MKIRLLLRVFLPLILVIGLAASLAGEDRFPQPEFETAYKAPVYQHPLPRSVIMSYVDVGVLILACSLAALFAIRIRNRRGLFAVMLGSLIYFGFYRKGCICPVGSIQNIISLLFENAYAIPLTAALFFIIPIIFTLLFGRVFCSSVCPLGAVQDVVAVRPVALPRWLNAALGMLPYVFLAFAVLFAATGTGYIICRFDPFVSFFRMTGDVWRLVLGGLFLVLGVFIARPYCRFLCPYGAILNFVSRFSIKHVTITPTECIQCRLCENSCPFDAIEVATPPDAPAPKNGVRTMAGTLALIPVMILIGGFLVSRLAPVLASTHLTVATAKQIAIEDADPNAKTTLQSQAFRSLGTSPEELAAQAKDIVKGFSIGGWIAGGFIGLAFGLTLAFLARRVRRKDYEPDRGRCLSCGRCFAYCPKYYAP
ncbi:MAG: 4Fe-4S binding protein [Spirochaetes bacterium]|nr:4Fe-4S binding protein [Spirochaetota bacterium]